MKSLELYIMEQDNNKEARLKEKLEKNNAAIEKANAQLDKTNKKVEKLLDSYKNDKALCEFVPFDVFNNFKYVSWKDVKALEQEYGKHIAYPYNPIACMMYYDKSKEYDRAVVDKFYWDYLTVMSDLIEKIHSIEVHIDEYTERIAKISSDMSQLSDNDSLVDELFDKVPQLKVFIDTVAEKQVEFLQEKSEKLKKALKRWEKEWEEWKEKNKDTKYRSFNDKYWAEENFKKEHKPKGAVLTKDQILRMVDDWKRSESLMLASRIKTEFGDVESTNLTIGVDGNVNGIIRGTNKTAKIETIWAGGYNIQCLHTRLLIHEK